MASIYVFTWFEGMHFEFIQPESGSKYSLLDFSAPPSLVYTNVMTMNQYLPGLLAVLEQGVDPKDAIAQIEAA